MSAVLWFGGWFVLYATILAVIRRWQRAREEAGLIVYRGQQVMLDVTGAGPWRSTQARHAAAPSAVSGM
jgi:hypothetical protein